MRGDGTGWTPLAAPPLDPSGDEARRLLRGELADPDYYDRNVVQRVLDWIGRQLDRGIGATAGLDWLQALVAVAVVVALVVALAALASRARRTARSGRTGTGPVLDGVRVSAAELRDRAERAWARGDLDGAVLDGFRALAVGQIEAGVVGDVPQATAGELARSIAAGQRSRAALATADAADPTADVTADLTAAAHAFDEVRYGEHPTDAATARAVLDLERRLDGRARAGR